MPEMAEVRLSPFERRDIASALTALAGLISIVGSLIAVPPDQPATSFWLIALFATGLGFAGAFGLWLDRAHRKLAAALFGGAALLLGLASPLVPAPNVARLTATFLVPSALFAVACALLAIPPSAKRRR